MESDIRSFGRQNGGVISGAACGSVEACGDGVKTISRSVAETLRRYLPPGWSYSFIRPQQDDGGDDVCFSHGVFDLASYQFQWDRTFLVKSGSTASGVGDGNGVATGVTSGDGNGVLGGSAGLNDVLSARFCVVEIVAASGSGVSDSDINDAEMKANIEGINDASKNDAAIHGEMDAAKRNNTAFAARDDDDDDDDGDDASNGIDIVGKWRDVFGRDDECKSASVKYHIWSVTELMRKIGSEAGHGIVEGTDCDIRNTDLKDDSTIAATTALVTTTGMITAAIATKTTAAAMTAATLTTTTTGSSTSNEKRPKRHKSEGHPVGRKFSSSLKCKICGECFEFAEAFVRFGLHDKLVAHCQLKHRHRQKQPKRGQFKCRSCDKTFTFEYLLKRHEAKKHDANNYQPTKTDKGEFVCKICDKVLSQLRHLERHVRLVHDSLPDDRPFVCEVCGKAFKTKFNLSKHHKTHQERPFKCGQCGAAFCARCELSYHEIIHTGEKPFLCQQCGKGFNTKTYLHQHQVKVCKVKKSAAMKSKPASHLSSPSSKRALAATSSSGGSTSAAAVVDSVVGSDPTLSILHEHVTASAAAAAVPTSVKERPASSIFVDHVPSLQHPESTLSRDSIFAPASIPWQEAHPTANDYALPLPLHHHPHHPQPLAPPLLTPAALPTAVATAVALPVSLPAVAASLPVTLPAATPLADPMTPSLDNHADLSVHILPDAPSSHQPLLYPISTMPSHLRLSFSAPQQAVPVQSPLEINQDSHHFRGPF